MSLFDQTFTENKRFFLYFGLPGFSVTSHNNPHSTKDAMTDGKNRLPGFARRYARRKQTEVAFSPHSCHFTE